MARNRQRAKERKQRQSRDNDLGLPDAQAGSPGFPPPMGGAPPDDLGTAPPPVDFDDEPEDDDDAAVDEADLGPGAGDVGPPAVAARKGGAIARIPSFVKACWAELQRVQWPDRKQVGQATAVVLGFVVIAGAFLGLADVVAQRIVDFIL
jgi:preprotein translocase SecE subunit